MDGVFTPYFSYFNPPLTSSILATPFIATFWLFTFKTFVCQPLSIYFITSFYFGLMSIIKQPMPRDTCITHSKRRKLPVPISLSHMHPHMPNTNFFVTILVLVTVTIGSDESFITDETLYLFQPQETFRHVHISDRCHPSRMSAHFCQFSTPLPPPVHTYLFFLSSPPFPVHADTELEDK